MWLDLTADGDVFVPDRRFGRSRRLIDGSLLLSHTLLPIKLAPSSQPVSVSLSLSSSSPVSSHLVSCLGFRPVFRHSSPRGSRFSHHLASRLPQHLVPLLSLFLLPLLLIRLRLLLLLPPLDSPVTRGRVWFREGTSRAPPSSSVFLPGRL